MSNDPHEDCNSGCHSDSCEHHGYLPVSGDMVSRADLDRAMAERFERLPTALNMIRQVIDAAPSAPTAPAPDLITHRRESNLAPEYDIERARRRASNMALLIGDAAPSAATEPPPETSVGYWVGQLMKWHSHDDPGTAAGAQRIVRDIIQSVYSSTLARAATEPGLRFEVRPNDDGTVDEVLVYAGARCVFHLEQMDDDAYWFAWYGEDGDDQHFDIVRRGKRVVITDRAVLATAGDKAEAPLTGPSVNIDIKEDIR